MASSADGNLQVVLAELPRLDDDALRGLYHEAVQRSDAFYGFLHRQLAPAPGETAANWLKRRLARLARDELLLLLVSVADSGFDDALGAMALRLDLAAQDQHHHHHRRCRRRSPPPGLPIRTATFADNPATSFDRLGEPFDLPLHSTEPPASAVPTLVTDGPGLGHWAPTPRDITGYPPASRCENAMPPPPPASPLDLLAEVAAAMGSTMTPPPTPPAPAMPPPPPASPLDLLAEVAAAMGSTMTPPPTPPAPAMPLRRAATTREARFNPLERPSAAAATPRGRRPGSTTSSLTAPPRFPAAAVPSPSPLDWRPPPLETPRRRGRLDALPSSWQRCVRCGAMYIEAKNTGRTPCRYHAAYPVADPAAAAWAARPPDRLPPPPPHFRPSLFEHPDLTDAFVWPCCGRRGGGPGSGGPDDRCAPARGCRWGMHVNDKLPRQRGRDFAGWERYGRRGKEEGEGRKGGWAEGTGREEGGFSGKEPRMGGEPSGNVTPD